MFKIIVIMTIISYLISSNIINRRSNNETLITDIKNCNEIAFNKIKNSNYINEMIIKIDNQTYIEMIDKDIKKINKIRKNCIQKKKIEMINNIIISYVAILGLLLVIYI